MSAGPAVTERNVEKTFSRLVDAWKSQRGATSSAAEMAMHPACQQIIGMGPEVLPLLFHEIKREPDHWFWALKAIAGVDPVPPESRGRLRAMGEAWLDWGRQQGYAV